MYLEETDGWPLPLDLRQVRRSQPDTRRPFHSLSSR
jgi:hypothetical protein